MYLLGGGVTTKIFVQHSETSKFDLPNISDIHSLSGPSPGGSANDYRRPRGKRGHESLSNEHGKLRSWVGPVPRLLKSLALYLTLAVLITLIIVGLLNTFLGDYSPIRAVRTHLEARFRELTPLPMELSTAVERLYPSGQSTPPDVAAPQVGPNTATERASHAPADDFDLCSVPRGSVVTVSPARTAYTWVNEDGVVSFGDEMPSDADARMLNLDTGPRDFKLNLVADGVIAPQALHGQLSAGAKRIYDQWYAWLGSERIQKAEVNVRLVGDQALFRRLWRRRDSASYPAGFYRMATNTVYIDYDPKVMTDERLFSLAFHELSHLIAAWQVGTLPPWFSEGLAEYFETMSVAGQGAYFPSASRWRNGIEDKQLLSMGRLLSLTRQDWWQGDVAPAYRSAGALFAFLYASDAGRTTLRRMALEASDRRCSRDKNKGIRALSAYPRGLAGLEDDLRDWAGLP